MFKIILCMFIFFVASVGCEKNDQSSPKKAFTLEKFVSGMFSPDVNRDLQAAQETQRRQMEAQKQMERLDSYGNKDYFKND